MFKKFLFLSSILFLTSTLTAQIGIGPRESMSAGSGNFKKDDLEKLKNSETVFLYKKSDDLGKLKKAVKEVWDFTEISFKPYSEKNNIPVNTSIFNISSLTNSNVSSAPGKTYSYYHEYMKLWLKTKDGKDENGITFARIELSSMSKDGDKYNYKIGFIKTYLKFINDQLKTGEERWLFEEVEKNYEALNELEDHTLYVPQFIFEGAYPSKSLSEEEFKEVYPYDFKIMEAEKISDKILESDEPIYFLVSVISDTDQFTSVYNSKTGEIIYTKYGHSLGYIVKQKDIKHLAKALKKAQKKK